MPKRWRITGHDARLCVCAVLVLIVGLQIACARERLLDRTPDSALTGRMAMRHTNWSGSETRRVRALEGQALYVDYHLAVEHGTIAVHVLDPNRVTMWELVISEGSAGSVRIPALRSGAYTVGLYGDSASGHSEITWQVH